MNFDSEDPFPLLNRESYSLRDAQVHAEKVDDWLGLETHRIESELLDRTSTGLAPTANSQELWIGLPVRSLLTPYLELRNMLADLDPKPDSTLVDLGAGYGRIAFVLARHYPQVNFIGYEYVRERVDEAIRCYEGLGLSKARMVHADLASPECELQPAESYFIYDFGSRAVIEKTLEALKAIALERPIQVVGRGRSSRDAIERNHPWLSQVNPARHFGNYSIYHS